MKESLSRSQIAMLKTISVISLIEMEKVHFIHFENGVLDVHTNSKHISVVNDECPILISCSDMTPDEIKSFNKQMELCHLLSRSNDNDD
jgi:hypothetical protein